MIVIDVLIVIGGIGLAVQALIGLSFFISCVCMPYDA